MNEIASILQVLYNRMPEESHVEKNLVLSASGILTEIMNANHEQIMKTEMEEPELKNEIVERKHISLEQVGGDLRKAKWNKNKSKQGEPAYVSYSKRTISQYLDAMKWYYDQHENRDTWLWEFNQCANPQTMIQMTLDNSTHGFAKTRLNALVRILHIYDFHIHDSALEDAKKQLNEQIMIASSEKRKQGIEKIEDMVPFMDAMKAYYDDKRPLLNDEWGNTHGICVFAHIYLNYAVLRNNELYRMRILDTDDGIHNHINITTKQIIIHDHKNQYKDGTRIIDIAQDEELLGLCKLGVGNYVISQVQKNKKGQPYNSTQSLYDMLKKELNIQHRHLRHIKSSIVLATKDLDAIQETAANQGHSIPVMETYYRTGVVEAT